MPLAGRHMDRLVRLMRAKGVRGMAWLLRSRLIPWLPLPSRLPFGGRWLAWNDVLGRCILLN